MQATIIANDSIVDGTNKVVDSVGMEIMSNAPHMLQGARGGLGTGHKTDYDHIFMD